MIVNGWRRKYLIPKPKKKKPKGYRGRRFALSDLGYESYAAYLASDDWKLIRAGKLERFPGCLLCPAPACQVHHMDYDLRTLLGLEPAMLVTLCDSCHLAIEFSGKVKRSLRETNMELRRRASLSKTGQRWLANLDRIRRDRKRRGARQGPAFNHRQIHKAKSFGKKDS